MLPASVLFFPREQDLHINTKEIAAVRLCIAGFATQLLRRAELLRVRTHSRATMHLLNGYSSRSPVFMAEFRKLHTVLALSGFNLAVSWLPSVSNRLADQLSRRQDRNDWRLAPLLVRSPEPALVAAQGGPLCDMSQRPRPSVQIRAPQSGQRSGGHAHVGLVSGQQLGQSPLLASQRGHC